MYSSVGRRVFEEILVEACGTQGFVKKNDLEPLFKEACFKNAGDKLAELRCGLLLSDFHKLYINARMRAEFLQSQHGKNIKKRSCHGPCKLIGCMREQPCSLQVDWLHDGADMFFS